MGDYICNKEKCLILAEELRTGERSWFLTPFNNLYFAYALSSKNINESGEGYHLEINRLEVQRLLSENKLINSPDVRIILTYY